MAEHLRRTGADTGPCPGCGERQGGRYWRKGRWLCWPCTGLKPEEPRPPTRPEWQQFRQGIIDKLLALDRERFWYIDSDRVIGECPVCRAALPEYLAVRFHGIAARADLVCSLGCPDLQLAAAFGLEIAP
jgi:hypothetical protein